jgi:hypothetical protein
MVFRDQFLKTVNKAVSKNWMCLKTRFKNYVVIYVINFKL